MVVAAAAAAAAAVVVVVIVVVVGGGGGVSAAVFLVYHIYTGKQQLLDLPIISCMLIDSKMGILF